MLLYDLEGKLASLMLPEFTKFVGNLVFYVEAGCLSFVKLVLLYFCLKYWFEIIVFYRDLFLCNFLCEYMNSKLFMIHYRTMIQNMISEGKIVPSEVTIKLLEKAIVENENDKFLIDGFPRNEENRAAFESVVSSMF